MQPSANASSNGPSRQNASQSAVSRTGWSVLEGGRRGCAGEEVRLLVELHNHAHLHAVYGRELAAQVLRQLRARLVQWGAQVQACDGAWLLARLDAASLQRLKGGAGSGQIDTRAQREVPSWLEYLQVQLSGAVLHVRGQRVLPMVVVSEVAGLGKLGTPLWTCGPGQQLVVSAAASSAAGGPEPGDSQGVAQWLQTYAQDMQLALQWHDALNQGRVSLALQPVQHLRSGEVLYREALLRVEPASRFTYTGSPNEPALSPEYLIPALERLGLVRGLDRVVVSAVLQRLDADAALHIGCNLSALSLVQDGWWGEVLHTLRGNRGLAERLTLEVTETMPVANFDAAVAFLRKLKALGCRIALDDVGSGYSSLGLARELRPEVIKVDAALLHAARGQEEGDLRLYRLVSYCQTLAHHVVLEGVEDAGDRLMAEQLEVQWVQGRGIQAPQAQSPVMAVLPVTAGQPLSSEARGASHDE